MPRAVRWNDSSFVICHASVYAMASSAWSYSIFSKCGSRQSASTA
jgi:hypothetical protein